MFSLIFSLLIITHIGINTVMGSPLLSNAEQMIIMSSPLNTKIQQFVDLFNSTDRIRQFATYLTGENPHSPITTRQAYSASGLLAAEWIKQQMTDMGYHCQFHYFHVNGYPAETAWNPNVVCDWHAAEISVGNTLPLVIVGAHYDDRQSDSRSTSARAPGANDDGSGTTLLLELASRISDFKARFQLPVRLIAFSGEEQGLYGSRAYAKECKHNHTSILAMLQADMVGYNSRLKNHPTAKKRLAFVRGNASPKLTSHIKLVVGRYVPELEVEDSLACCSDHQSFHEQGYESVGFVESGGYIIDPQYHKQGDLVNRPGYDLEQIRMISKSVAAALADLARLE